LFTRLIIKFLLESDNAVITPIGERIDDIKNKGNDSIVPRIDSPTLFH